ncbi:MAG TPA: CPBP family intramembrane glutamic endopeptidase [Chloroflexota bacterium]|nr:CPBP family intramembrane glutamic endopeptidase [Chloroflexota bacterium]
MADAAPGAAAAPRTDAPPGPAWDRGVLVFLAVAFGVAWALWGLLWLGGGLARPDSYAFLVASMYGPALGVLAAWRLADPQALRVSGVRRRGPWRWYLWAYLLIPALLILGAAFCVLVGVQRLDPTFALIREQAARLGQPPPPPPPLGVAVLMALPAFVVGPFLNVPATIGEELGWRGYLWARLKPLGPRRAAVLIGLIWGGWHAPLIAMGYNYPDAPLLGPLLMTGFTVVYGVILGWLRARSGSVWPAALAHGAINAEALAVAVFLTPASRLAGAPIGVVALAPAAVCAAWLLWRGRWTPPERAAPADSAAPGGSPTGAPL